MVFQQGWASYLHMGQASEASYPQGKVWLHLRVIPGEG